MIMLYMRDPSPDLKKIRKEFGCQLLKLHMFSSIFELKNNLVYSRAIPKEEVDLTYHIDSIDGNGTFDEEDLNKLVAKTSNEWWERTDKPLWKVSVISNLKDGRSMLFCKIDHSLGDGTTMVAALESILDVKPPKKVDSLSRKLNVQWSHRIVSFLHGCYFGSIGWTMIRSDSHNGFRIPSSASLLQESKKAFTKTKAYDLNQIMDMKKKMAGTTINDILMGVITIGAKRYFEATKDPILNKLGFFTKLQGMAAVDLRSKMTNEKILENMDNNFMVATFDLPLTFKTVIEAVWKSKKILDFEKLSPGLYIVGKFCLPIVKNCLPEKFFIKETVGNVRKSSIVISNVKGPSHECKVAGYTIDDINFSNSSPVGFYVGMLSYNNKLHFSFTTDKRTKIDTDLLRECIEKGFDALHEEIMNDPRESIPTPDITPLAAKLLEFSILPAIIMGLYLLLKG